ncbi:MAG: hypothetical protein SGPRY_009705, partial [Prymnesium sp.]
MVLPIAKIFRGSRTSELHRQFHSASAAAYNALETADCLAPLQDRQHSLISDGRIQLSKDDWFELYGLREVAIKGACTTKPPPWWTHKNRSKWQAWHAQGNLAPAEAKIRFVQTITKVPGFVIPEDVDDCHWLTDFLPCSEWFMCDIMAQRHEREVHISGPQHESSPNGFAEAVAMVSETAGRMTGAMGDALGLKRRSSPDPSSEPPSSDNVQNLLSGGVTMVSPPLFSATIRELGGQWEQRHVEGLEAYLKQMGVAWPLRQAALSFTPKQSWTFEEGVAKMSMTSPVGERVEYFPFGCDHAEKDLNGKLFHKRSSWEGGTLIARSRADD